MKIPEIKLLPIPETIEAKEALGYKWNEKADRTYRLSNEINFGGSHKHYAVSAPRLAAAL